MTQKRFRGRKQVITMIAAFVLVLAAGLTGCGKNSAKETGSEKKDDYVFQIGTANNSLCLAPLHVAVDNGYFEEEFAAAGLKYKLVEIEMAQAPDLITTGKIDGCVGLSGTLIPQIDSGLDISFTGGLHTGCTKYYVQADSKINAVEDLKGKTVGVPSLGDSSVIALKRKLFAVGVSVSTDNMEVKLVPYNMTDLPLALSNGAVDAIALHDPVAYSAEQEYGFKKILDLTEDSIFKKEYCCQIYVSNQAYEKHPEAAAAYTRALLKGAAYVQAKPEEAAKLQLENKQCSGELETNTKLLSSYNYTPSVNLAKETYRKACGDLIEIGDLQEGRDLDEFTEAHFKTFNNVPESYKYDEKTNTFTEVSKGKETTDSNCCP